MVTIWLDRNCKRELLKRLPLKSKLCRRFEAFKLKASGKRQFKPVPKNDFRLAFVSDSSNLGITKADYSNC